MPQYNSNLYQKSKRNPVAEIFRQRFVSAPRNKLVDTMKFAATDTIGWIRLGRQIIIL